MTSHSVQLLQLSHDQQWAGLPEGAPSNVALAEVLMAGGLFYQQLHLTVHIQGTLVGEVIICGRWEEVSVCVRY